MAKNFRSGRIGEEIRKIISGLILNDLQDKRLPLLTSVTEVVVTRDLSIATIYVSVMGDETEKQDALDVLKKAEKHIRHEISKGLALRHTPELRFELDTSLDYGSKIEAVIKKIHEE